MLLRNMSRNLCNGTRLIVRKMHQRMPELQLLTEDGNGETIFLPRIDLAPSDSGLPFILKQKQFPICQAFAMTINKSQSQTLKHVGVHPPAPVFTHGQLYVALSRVTAAENLKIRIVESAAQGNLLGDGRIFTKTIVFKEVLQTALGFAPLHLEEDEEQMEFQFGCENDES